MIPVLVEGDTDVPVVRRLLQLVGLELGTVYGLRGKNWVDQRLAAYNSAARHARWFVLRDLNRDAPCAPTLIQRILPAPAVGMCFRISVRATESWLLADRDRIAQFLSVPTHRIPWNPDLLQHPKMEIVSLARRSRRRDIREDMVPVTGTSARVGPGYTARIMEFAANVWNPQTARRQSLSLARCIAALERWAE